MALSCFFTVTRPLKGKPHTMVTVCSCGFGGTPGHHTNRAVGGLIPGFSGLHVEVPRVIVLNTKKKNAPIGV